MLFYQHQHLKLRIFSHRLSKERYSKKEKGLNFAFKQSTNILFKVKTMNSGSTKMKIKYYKTPMHKIDKQQDFNTRLMTFFFLLST